MYIYLILTFQVSLYKLYLNYCRYGKKKNYFREGICY
jgi:hypothetical protein